MDLTEKYRPINFDEIVGNEDTVMALKAICGREKGLPSAILLIGPRGCGKTTIAHVIKKTMKVSDRDFTELNTANVRGIDTIRDVDTVSRFASMTPGGKKIYFFDECHKLTNDAQNALLKLLEKPPKDVHFILATTDPEKLLKTVRSRCTIYGVSLLSNKEIAQLVREILFEEGRDKDFPKEAITEIAYASEGSPREALVLLDSVLALKNPDDITKAITNHNVAEATTLKLCQALYGKKPWKEIAEMIQVIDDEPEQIRYAVLGYMNSILIGNKEKKSAPKDDPRAVYIITNFLDSYMYTKKSGLIVSCYRSVTA